MPWRQQCRRCHNRRHHLGQHTERDRQSINDHKCTHDNRRRRRLNRRPRSKVPWSLCLLAILANAHLNRWSNGFWLLSAPSSTGNVCRLLDSVNTSKSWSILPFRISYQTTNIYICQPQWTDGWPASGSNLARFGCGREATCGKSRCEK